MDSDIDAYIFKYPDLIQEHLKKLLTTIRKAAPKAEESLSYGMPAFKLNGKPLVYFAAYKHHIGFYATPTGHKKFARQLSAYKQGKGSVQFPIDKELPFELIEKIVKFRVEETKRAETKKK